MDPAWIRFLSGRWSRNMPAKSGWYPVASQIGEVPSANCFMRFIGTHDGVIPVPGPWTGYVWSEPLPLMPAVPEDVNLRERDPDGWRQKAGEDRDVWGARLLKAVLDAYQEVIDSKPGNVSLTYELEMIRQDTRRVHKWGTKVARSGLARGDLSPREQAAFQLLLDSCQEYEAFLFD